VALVELGLAGRGVGAGVDAGAALRLALVVAEVREHRGEDRVRDDGADGAEARTGER
jgi:hypothetical protein